MLRFRFLGALTVSMLLGSIVTASPEPARAAVQFTAPVRVLDTRSGTGGAAQPLVPGAVRRLTLPTGIAADRTAVALNLTGDRAAAPGFVSAWSCADPEPATSVLNVFPGRPTPNMIALRNTADGLCFRASTTVDLIADVTAVMNTTDYTGIAPQRLLDTRSGQALQGGQELALDVADRGGVPGSAPAAALNVTVVARNQPGFVSVTPCGTQTGASTLNFLAGDVVPHFTFTGLGSGRACLTASTTVDVIVDTFGWLPGAGALDPITPSRLLDTRSGVGGRRGAVGSGELVRVRVAGNGGVPNDAAGATVNLVGVGAAAPGYVNAWPCDAAEPSTSVLNVSAGLTRANQVTLALGPSGEVCLRPTILGSTRLDLVLDAVGAVAGSVPREPPPPATTPGDHFATLPVGAQLPSGAECAARVQPVAELRPDNTQANHTRGGSRNSRTDWPGFARVDGDFVGTTDEIIQWAACKWGIDEDIVRAQVVKESAWHQSANGDNGESWGLGQVRDTAHQSAFPDARTSSAYNLDYTYASWRACYEGAYTWLNQFERGRDYAAGDEWGCVGLWYAGRWYTDAVTVYLDGGATNGYGDIGVRQHLDQRTWEQPDFVNW